MSYLLCKLRKEKITFNKNNTPTYSLSLHYHHMKKKDEGWDEEEMSQESGQGEVKRQRKKEIEKTEGTQRLIHLFIRLLLSTPHVSHCARPFPAG